jgi:hypothetical protein
LIFIIWYGADPQGAKATLIRYTGIGSSSNLQGGSPPPSPSPSPVSMLSRSTGCSNPKHTAGFALERTYLTYCKHKVQLSATVDERTCSASVNLAEPACDRQ